MTIKEAITFLQRVRDQDQDIIEGSEGALAKLINAANPLCCVLWTLDDIRNFVNPEDVPAGYDYEEIIFEIANRITWDMLSDCSDGNAHIANCATEYLDGLQETESKGD